MEWLRCILVYGSALLPGLVLLPVAGGRAALRISPGAERSLHWQGPCWTGLTVIYSFLGHKNFSFRVAGNVARNAVTTGVEPPAEGIAERLIAEPATKAAKRV